MIDSWIYILFGAFLGFLLVTKHAKAPSVKLLEKSLLFYIGVILISAAFTCFGRSIDIVKWSVGLQLICFSVALWELVKAFIAHEANSVKVESPENV